MKLLVCGHSAKLSASIHSYYGVERGSLRVELPECALAYAALKCSIWEAYTLSSYIMTAQPGQMGQWNPWLYMYYGSSKQKRKEKQQQPQSNASYTLTNITFAVS